MSEWMGKGVSAGMGKRPCDQASKEASESIGRLVTL